jgi:multimeric flavodoxin WrbA
MTRNLVILEGSPRKQGNTCVLAAQAAKAAKDDGAEVTSFHLQSMKISPCNGCDGCVRKNVYCTTEDDMQLIYPKLYAADALLLASPIYWFNYTAQLKTCMDRLYGLWNFDRDFLRDKPVGIILAYGDVDLYVSGAINAIHTFETSFRFLNARIEGWLYGSLSDIGDAEKHPEMMKAAADLGVKLVMEKKVL